MKNKIILTIVLLICMVVCAGSLSAQELQLIPITSAGLSTSQSTGIQATGVQSQLPPQTGRMVPKPGGAVEPEFVDEELSEFEKYVSGSMSFTVSTDIRQFGYDLFKQVAPKSTSVKKTSARLGLSEQSIGFEPVVDVEDKEYRPEEQENRIGVREKRRLPSTFAPVTNVPVGPDYLIGPGDEVKVTIWGKVEGQWIAVVDRDGNITLPKAGILGVAGLTFKELKDLLFKELSRYYTGFQMNVSMGALRSIRVYLVGNAQQPGSYTISALSTLVNALFETGGPSKTGSLRDIQVKRKGKTIAHFDMYDFLLKGDKGQDIRLMPEDVIFIPPVGSLVAIAGSVNTPAIYELKGETTVSDLIDTAGGLSAIAFRGRVQIERVVDNSRQTVFESSLEDVQGRDIIVQAGDLVKIFQVVQDRKVVRLTGAVQRQGEYGVSRGMTVKDLISMAGGLKYYAYKKESELTRVFVTEKGPKTEKIIIDLEKALAGDTNENVLLKENDYLFVRTVPEWRLYKTASITGEVKFPGVYTIKKGERLSSLIERAGGYTNRAYLKGTVFEREKVRALQQAQIDEMVDRLEIELLSAGTAQATTAASQDAARLLQLETKQKRRFIEKLRTIKAKGRIAIQSYTPDKLIGTPYDIEIEDGDSVHIPTNPNVVQTLGAVYNQTAFVYEKGRSVKYYINLAGGYTANAADTEIYLFKANGSAIRAGGGFLGLSWNSEYSRWEIGGMVESGDTIVVPEKLERIAWMRNVKDITQILYQIAVTAGVVFAALP